MFKNSLYDPPSYSPHILISVGEEHLPWMKTSEDSTLTCVDYFAKIDNKYHSIYFPIANWGEKTHNTHISMFPNYTLQNVILPSSILSSFDCISRAVEHSYLLLREARAWSTYRDSSCSLSFHLRGHAPPPPKRARSRERREAEKEREESIPPLTHSFHRSYFAIVGILVHSVQLIFKLSDFAIFSVAYSNSFTR